MGKNLLISFSGGETSAFMAQWLQKHAHKHGFTNLVFVYANTGQENEETLEFVKKCDDHFGFNTYWIESVVHHGERKGTTHKLVDFETASRNGEPFEQIIQKYGIPNQAFPHCTRELKQAPIKSFAREYFNGKKYWTAIGIRIDEIDRMNAKRIENRFVYPLIESSMIPFTKQKVNFYWKNQPFRLNLKGYQGNCVTCWKKSDPKLYQIAIENEASFQFMDEMESKYPRVGFEFEKEGRHYQIINNKYEIFGMNYKVGDKVDVETKRFIANEFGGYYAHTTIIAKNIEDKIWYPKDRVFFRSHRTAKDMIAQSKEWGGFVRNDAIDYNQQLEMFESESCEVFSECGS